MPRLDQVGQTILVNLFNMNEAAKLLIDNTKKFGKVVVLGLKTQYHTHRYIHAGFFGTLKKLGIPAVWIDYSQGNIIQPGDLVISAYVKGKNVGEINLPIKTGVYYCLHNFAEEVCTQIDPKFLLRLQVYTTAAEKADQKWDEVTFFDTKLQTLFQPWGANLLPEEFKPPTFNNHKFVFWIGSVWDNELHQGNVEQIAELKQALAKFSLKFKAVRFVPDWLNVRLIRYSRLAPAIAGRWQAENNYLPCRMFKNISYGQLGFSNVKKFGDLLKNCNIEAESIQGLVEKLLSLSKSEYLETIRKQQEIVKSQTYVNKLNNICKALETIK